MRSGPPVDDPGIDPEEHRHRKGLKFRRRDDYAVELFKEGLAHLDDRERVDLVLQRLGRFYNPYIDQPIVDLTSRRRILESLDAGDREAARRLLDERLKLYAKSDERESC